MNKLSILFAALFAVALSACGKKEEPVAPAPAPVEQAAPAAEQAAPAAEQAAGRAEVNHLKWPPHALWPYSAEELFCFAFAWKAPGWPAQV